ncbi:MAG: F0F1 ATP synthase subunit epsilon [Candidatus Promineifilaceae bacterium]
MPLHCDIVTQERTVFSGPADYVSLPGAEGRMGVLPNHSPLLTALFYGEVMVRYAGQEQYFAIGGGFAEVLPESVIVLADSAERADEIDLQRAEAARGLAHQAMAQGVRQDAVRYAQIEAELKRAQIRIDVSRRRAGGRRRTGLPDLGGDEENV